MHCISVFLIAMLFKVICVFISITIVVKLSVHVLYTMDRLAIGQDPQTEAWVGGCAHVYVVETTLRSIGQANQKAMLNTASM